MSAATQQVHADMHAKAEHDYRFKELLVPREMVNDHRSNGGTGLRRFVGDTRDGKVLRVMYGHEPAGVDNAMVWHASVSVAESPDVGAECERLPTDAEFNAAALHAFGMIPYYQYPLPSETLVRHAWQLG